MESEHCARFIVRPKFRNAAAPSVLLLDLKIENNESVFFFFKCSPWGQYYVGSTLRPRFRNTARSVVPLRLKIVNNEREFVKTLAIVTVKKENRTEKIKTCGMRNKENHI